MERCVFTLGHSAHPWPHFLELLREAGVKVVVDVRSQPYSRHAKQYSKGELVKALRQDGFNYFFLGRELGGRPVEAEWYQPQGGLDMERRRDSDIFRGGILRLEDLASRAATVLLCSEEDPVRCHRHLLIGPALMERGWALTHLRGDGTAEDDGALIRRREPQLALF